ncbi:MAG: phosphoribosylanthranilate isomerase [Thermoprotei archaeon]
MTKIKICGNTRPEDIQFEAKTGAHAVGLIHGFPESPRNNSFERAKTLVRYVPPFTEAVVVTNIQGLESAARLGVRTIQLVAPIHLYSSARFSHPELNIIPVLYVGGEPPKREVLKVYSEFEYVHVDTDSGLKGGSGQTHNWEVSKMLSKVLGNIILAGGLTPENVEDAITMVEPYAVDVSSGVESSPGVKHWGLVSRFIEAVKRVG